MSAIKRRAQVSGLALVVLLASGIAHADSDDGVRAQSLYDDAVKLLEQGDYAHACPMLAESFTLDPAGGTSLDLAFCYEREGRSASALAAYRSALDIAERDGRDDRKVAAAAKIAAIEKSVARLRLIAPRATWQSEGWQVLLDARALGPDEAEKNLEIDAGSHVVTVTAAHKKTFAQRVAIADGAMVEVKIELLPSGDAEPPVSLRPTRKPTDSSRIFVLQDDVPRRNWGIGVAATGAAAIGVGVIAGIVAASLHARSTDECPATGCSGEGASDERRANGYAWTSDIAFVGGAALVGVGAYLFFSAKHARRVPAFTEAASGKFVFDLR